MKPLPHVHEVPGVQVSLWAVRSHSLQHMPNTPNATQTSLLHTRFSIALQFSLAKTISILNNGKKLIEFKVKRMKSLSRSLGAPCDSCPCSHYLNIIILRSKFLRYSTSCCVTLQLNTVMKPLYPALNRALAQPLQGKACYIATTAEHT